MKYKELNLTKTWFIDLENYPANTLALAHQYASEYKWDSYAINPSWDLYGGGGIAATAKESALFFQYLFDGKIIQDKQILKAMHTYVLPSDQSKYCLGLYHFDMGFNAYYHGGWWGLMLFILRNLMLQLPFLRYKKTFNILLILLSERNFKSY
ncbi:hypothetical protein KUH03_02325 [Sphingobacterium sp. E70]|uniref:hypothetical protein n=1 Tax=Sphingobacterium sp. E70 TaxID=2853439 RepID=UPI00211C3559|nr:hypothetical protein [Sphingobacterium sp. E70]ULT25846.1 hypothetical protein KUH03_02325 [Sphingobacterium sp. E70]